MHSAYRIKFDGRKLVDYFGGVSAAIDALKTVGVVMKEKTLQKQRERDNMPGDVVASLLLASVRLGRPINPYDFLLERSEE